ncbi:hypothetical protein AB0N17_13610 [Streptomyces sp. NPDC051133]|uniref:hypothetical protein n=1 Tax=Streptomyces sp. NPDC051133 TaxID=3155521 RepID=UPI003432DE01
MVSERRRARMQPAAEPVGDVPDWVWGDEFRARRWVRDHGGSVEGRYEAYQEWRERCRRWLNERGLVIDGVNVQYHEFKRIEREEPHRILRRPRPS